MAKNVKFGYLLGLVLAALSVTGFASTFVVGAALTKECGVSPEVLAFLRFVIAGGVMLAVALATAKGRRKLLSPTKADWLKMAWLGPVGTSLMAWCVFMGCARVSAANASMADALTPLMIFAVAALRSRHIEPRELVGLVCGFIGALLVVQIVHAGGIALEAYTMGDVFVLLAAATWGFYTVYGREQIHRLGSSVFTTWTMLLGAAALGLVILLLSTLNPQLSTLNPQLSTLNPQLSTFNFQPSTFNFSWPSTPRAWTLTAVLGLVSTLLPFWTWNAAQKYLPMSVLGISAYFTPVVAVALAIVFLGEPATWLQWLGTLFIVASASVETGRRREG